MRVRLGAVSYLNTRPLVEGLDLARFEVRFDVPARCAALLHEGAIDAGVIPSIEYARGDYVIVPGVAIASEGPVASVAVFSPRPLAAARTVALDTSSRTSVALLRVLCRERFGISPEFVHEGPDLDRMLARADAALLIGDPALWTDHASLGLEKTDLGEQWTAHTGLPFVWAFWAGRPDAIGPAEAVAFAEARDRGEAAIDRIASEYASGDPARAARAARYLREDVRFDFGPRQEAALARFYASAARLGLIAQAPPLRFVALECAAGRGRRPAPSAG
jgi:chorismate dehydratase